VVLEERQSLVIAFADGTTISLSLKEDDYPVPEAVIFNGRDRMLIII
jgi:hypothetical protein